MRDYTTPSLEEYGDVATLTGIFGQVSTGDVLTDENGNVVLEGDGSIDACAEENGECLP